MSGMTSFSGRTLLRIAEAASVLGVSRQTVYRLIDAGKLDAVKIQGIIRIHRNALAGREGTQALPHDGAK